MPLNDKNGEEPAIGSLVERLAAGSTDRSGTECPEEDQLAALATGRLLPEERAAIDQHLAGCRSCREEVASLVRWHRRDEEANVGQIPSPMSGAGVERARHRSRLLLLAAAVLILATLVWVGKGIFSQGGPRSSATGKERFLAAVEDLKHSDPELFDSFTPLSRVELLAPSPLRQRGNQPVLLHPTGVSLTEKPCFEWEPLGGVTSYRISLFSGDGVRLWTEQMDEASFELSAEHPPLESGSKYLWEINCRDPLGREIIQRRVFSVATDEERKFFEDAKTAIESKASRTIAPLFVAQLAIRMGFYRDAEKSARIYVQANEEDVLGRETLFHALQLIGSSESGILGVDELED